MSPRYTSRYLAWIICALLLLGAQPGQLTRSLASALSARSVAPQQGQSQSNTEEHSDHPAEESLKGFAIRVGAGGTGPTRGWLVLRAAVESKPVPPEPLAAEDVRHVLLPRRAPPPEPDRHA